MGVSVRAMFFRTLLLLLAAAAGARADLLWDQPIQEFHRLPEDRQVTTAFTFKNTGPEPVAIKSVKTTCGCTVADYTRKTYAPGESGKVEVRYMFQGGLSAQKKTVTVRGDGDRMWKLEMIVFLHPPLKLEPALVWWKVGQPPEVKTVRLSVGEGRKVAVKSVASTNPRVSARIETVRAGEEYVVTVKPVDTAARESAEVTVLTDYPAEDPRTYTIFARIK